VPGGIHWDEWLGPAPKRDFHDGLHSFGWRTWRQFGPGTVGAMACHNLDIRVDLPTSVPLRLRRKLFQPDKDEKIAGQVRSDKDSSRSLFEEEIDEILIVEGLLSVERIGQISETGKYQPR